MSLNALLACGTFSLACGSILLRLQPSGYFEFDPERGQVKFDIPLEKKSYLVNNTRTKCALASAAVPLLTIHSLTHSYKFKFDGLFPSDTTQDSIFETVAQEAADKSVGNAADY